MKRFVLTLTMQGAQDALAEKIFDEVFLWDTDTPTTVRTSLDPYLIKLGVIHPANIDLVRVAVAVYLADLSVPRRGRGSNWNVRNFELTVPVGDPDTWTIHSEDLAAIVKFLSGDSWRFRFTEEPTSSMAPLITSDQTFDRTILFSGGADSACGAIYSAHHLKKGQTQELISHFSQTVISPIQKAVAGMLDQFSLNAKSVHRQVRLQRSTTRLDGTKFAKEPSSRSRSLLFLALGMAFAQRSLSPLIIPENGFASLNPPLSPSRRGSLSTRTTHPLFLRKLSNFVSKIGGYSDIQNPFALMTKGEMFQKVADIIGAESAARYLSATHSCSHTNARFLGARANTPCGVCFGCYIRRAAFAASGVRDMTCYLIDDTSGDFDQYVKKQSIQGVLKNFVRRGITERDIISLSLPDDFLSAEALSLCKRSISEIEAILP